MRSPYIADTLYSKFEDHIKAVIEEWILCTFQDHDCLGMVARQNSTQMSGDRIIVGGYVPIEKSWNLQTMLGKRQAKHRWLSGLDVSDIYVKIMNSNSFAGELTRICQGFWTDLNGLEALQAVTFIQRHYAYAQWRAELLGIPGECSPYLLRGLFGSDPNDDEEMEEQRFQITYQLCKILLNPNNRVSSDLWTIIRDDRENCLVFLAEEIDELESLIEGATETA